MYEENINFSDIVYLIKKRWRLVISSIFLGTILSIIATQFLVEPLYSVRSKIFIGSKNQNDEVHKFRYDDGEEPQEGDTNYILMYQRLLDTYSEVLTSREVVKDAIDNYGIDITIDDALFGLTISGKKDTQILMITYTGSNRVICRDIVRAMSNELLKISKDIVPNVDAKIVQTATLPQSAIFPKKRTNILVGLFLGTFIGIGLAFLLEFMNGCYRNAEQVENILGIQVLGLIPDENKEDDDYYYEY